MAKGINPRRAADNASRWVRCTSETHQGSRSVCRGYINEQGICQDCRAEEYGIAPHMVLEYEKKLAQAPSNVPDLSLLASN